MVARWLILLFLFGSATGRLFSHNGFYLSPRAQGRGGAHVAGLTGVDAVVFNPAHLAENPSELQFTLSAFDLFYGENTLALIGDAISSVNSTDGFGFIRSFDDKFGQGQYARAQLTGLGLRYGSFSMSPFLSNESSLEVQNPPVPSVLWSSDTLAGFNISYGLKISKHFNAGVSLRPEQRIYLHGDLAFTDIIDLLLPEQVAQRLTTGLLRLWCWH